MFITLTTDWSRASNVLKSLENDNSNNSFIIILLFPLVRQIWSRIITRPATARTTKLIPAPGLLCWSSAVWPDGSKFCQILSYPSKNGQRLLKFSQSGKISPNLVTLVKWHYSNKINSKLAQCCFHVRFQDPIFALKPKKFL